eukprot:SAG31_NODE_2267_length_6052_cov_7.222241_2_plen_311_part_00
MFSAANIPARNTASGAASDQIFEVGSLVAGVPHPVSISINNLTIKVRRPWRVAAPLRFFAMPFRTSGRCPFPSRAPGFLLRLQLQVRVVHPEMVMPVDPPEGSPESGNVAAAAPAGRGCVYLGVDLTRCCGQMSSFSAEKFAAHQADVQHELVLAHAEFPIGLRLLPNKDKLPLHITLTVLFRLPGAPRKACENPILCGVPHLPPEVRHAALGEPPTAPDQVVSAMPHCLKDHPAWSAAAAAPRARQMSTDNVVLRHKMAARARWTRPEVLFIYQTCVIVSISIASASAAGGGGLEAILLRLELRTAFFF